MAKRKERKFGEVPAWALQGPWNVRNYDLRAEHFMGMALKAGERTFPFLRLPQNRFAGEETADLWLWLEFWFRHLGASVHTVPRTVALFLDGTIGALNVPEERPEEIDPTFESTALWEPTDWLRRKVEPPEPALDPKARARVLAEWRGRIHSRDKLKNHPDLEPEVWDAMSGEEVREMYLRAGIIRPADAELLINGRGPPYPPGTRVNWVQAEAHREATAGGQVRGKNPWKRLSDETLRAMYPKHGDEHAAVRKPDDPV